MFSKITLDNFKSFRHIELDLADTKNTPKSSAFIYGENGSGKSNLVEAFSFLFISISTLVLKSIPIKEQNKLEEKDAIHSQEVKKAIDLFESTNFPQHLFKTFCTIGTSEDTSLRFDFILNRKKGFYTVSFNSEGRIVSEELSFSEESRIKTLFKIFTNDDNLEFYISRKLFLNTIFKKNFFDSLKKYWGRHTFFAILFNERVSNNNKYMSESVSPTLLNILTFFTSTSTQLSNCDFVAQFSFMFNAILFNLTHGKVHKKKKNELLVFEEALDSFFTRLYSDVRKVFYDIKEEDDDNISYELHFSKNISGKVVNVSHFSESTGTKKLLKLFPYFYQCITGNVVVIDEIDSGIHDVLFSSIIKEFENDIKGQFIVTTHNTSLLKHLNKKNAYIIYIDFDGTKTIKSLNSIDKKSQKNHNNQNRYLSGTFGGIPYSTELYLDEIVKNIEDSYKE